MTCIVVREGARGARLDPDVLARLLDYCPDTGTLKWKATVFTLGTHHYLGLFDVQEEAIAARASKLSELNFHPNHGRAS